MSRQQIYASAGTVAVMALIALWLCLSRLGLATDADHPWPPADSARVEMAEQYIEPEIEPLAHSRSEAAQGEPVQGPAAAPGQASGQEMADAGTKAPAPTPLTQKTPSPIKVKVPKEAPKTDGTPRPRPTADQQRARDINTSVQGAFSPKKASSSGNSPSSAANPDGGNTSRESTGVSAGVANIGNGWSLDHTGPVGGRGKPLGTVVIRVRVDAQGRVTSATAAGGTPPAGTDRATIQECLAAARQSTFRLQQGREAARTTSGTITWRFH